MSAPASTEKIQGEQTIQNASFVSHLRGTEMVALHSPSLSQLLPVARKYTPTEIRCQPKVYRIPNNGTF